MRAPVTVTAVIPSYNSAKLLPRCIESVLTQTVPVSEILVIDDGSTDNTAEVVAQFPAPVRLIQQKNAGVAAARNAGIRAAAGEWIGFLDADDRWLPNKTELELRCAARHPNAAVIYCDADVLLPDGSSAGQFLSDKGPKSGRVYDRLLESFFVLPSTALVRRDALISCGMFTEHLRKMEDYDLWIRMARQYEFQLVSAALTLYERQPTSATKDTLGVSRAQVVFLRSLMGGSLTSEQNRKLRMRVANSLFDQAYELRAIDPRESVSLAWESVTTNPKRLRAWELWMKCLATDWFHLAR